MHLSLYVHVCVYSILPQLKSHIGYCVRKQQSQWAAPNQKQCNVLSLSVTACFADYNICKGRGAIHTQAVRTKNPPNGFLKTEITIEGSTIWPEALLFGVWPIFVIPTLHEYLEFHLIQQKDELNRLWWSKVKNTEHVFGHSRRIHTLTTAKFIQLCVNRIKKIRNTNKKCVSKRSKINFSVRSCLCAFLAVFRHYNSEFYNHHALDETELNSQCWTILASLCLLHFLHSMYLPTTNSLNFSLSLTVFYVAIFKLIHYLNFDL